MNLFMSTSRNSDILPRKMQGAFLAIFGLLFPRKLWYFAILKKGEEHFLAFLDKIFAFFGVFMRKAKSIFQGKNEPVWVRPNIYIIMMGLLIEQYCIEFEIITTIGR